MPRDVPVLIVGGSLVGLSTAAILGRHGVRTLVVEHHRGTAIHPRAAQVNQRTMEIFRELGLEARIRERSAEQFVQDGAIVAVESLAGRELASFVPNLNEGIRDASPSERVFISQSVLEPELKGRAEALGAELRFGADVVAIAQDDESVTARVRDRDSGREETVRAAYLIGADGAHSFVRRTLDIATAGRGVFSKSATIYFRANVERLLRGRNLSVVYVNHPALRGFLRFEKPFDHGFLAVNAVGDPERPHADAAEGLTPERCVEFVRLALGDPALQVDIESVMPWNAEASVAVRLRTGRVFLAGDSAHAMPPNGGFGGNTGVHDGHNLAWKLALVLRGGAGASLLDSYEEERLPVGRFTTEQAYSRYVTRTAPYLGTHDIEPIVDDLVVELGYAYASAALCLEPGAPPHGDPRQSKGRPGTRAPHLWLMRDGQRLSALDLFGRSFVLLAGDEAAGWCSAAAALARTGIPLEVHRIGPEERIRPVEGSWTDAYGVSPRGAVLVRPDGFVGWRAADAGTVDAAGALERIIARTMGTLLCREVAVPASAATRR